MRSEYRTLAIVSATLTVASVFLPAVRVPLFGTMSFYEYWQLGAIAVAVLGALALGATIMRSARPIPILGVAALFFIARAAMRLHQGGGRRGGSAVREIMTGLAASAELTWGYYVLCVAAVALVVAGVLMQQHPGAADA